MASQPIKALRGIRVLSLALNLPGPAALLRLASMGARCTKIEPPAVASSAADAKAGASADPMSQYSPSAYAALSSGIRIVSANLKTAPGQAVLHKELARSDVLLTSFRPSALAKLGLSWKALQRQYPALSQVAIVGAPGALAELPGHDLTYLAEAGLVPGLDLPATLFADMAGSLGASQAVLQAVLARASSGQGVFQEVALSDAAQWLALPRTWGLTQASGMVGGAHAGYRVYACKDGRVAVAALEPHFAAALCAAAGLARSDQRAMLEPATQQAIAAYLLTQTRRQLDRLALAKDIPLHTLGK